MPQLQIYDDTPQKNTGPLSSLSQSFGEQLTKNISGQREQEAVSELFNAYKDGEKTVEDVYGNLFGNPRIDQKNQSNIANVLKNLDEKKVANSEGFKIVEALRSQDYSGWSYQDIVKDLVDKGISLKKAQEVAQQIRVENTNTRINLENIRKSYQDEIKRKTDEKKTARSDDRKRLTEEINVLQKQMKEDLNRFRSGDRNFIPQIEQVEEAASEMPPEVAQTIETLTQKLPPAQNEGEIIQKNGVVYISDGTQWVPQL